jgi:hypothetical protein
MPKFYYYLYLFLEPENLDFPDIPDWYKPKLKSEWLRAWLFYCIRNPKDTHRCLSPKLRTRNLKNEIFDGFENYTDRQNLEGIGGQTIGECLWYTKDYKYFKYNNVSKDGKTWFHFGVLAIPRLHTTRGSLSLMIRKVE